MDLHPPAEVLVWNLSSLSTASKSALAPTTCTKSHNSVDGTDVSDADTNTSPLSSLCNSPCRQPVSFDDDDDPDDGNVDGKDVTTNPTSFDAVRYSWMKRTDDVTISRESRKSRLRASRSSWFTGEMMTKPPLPAPITITPDKFDSSEFNNDNKKIPSEDAMVENASSDLQIKVNSCPILPRSTWHSQNDELLKSDSSHTNNSKATVGDIDNNSIRAVKGFHIRKRRIRYRYEMHNPTAEPIRLDSCCIQGSNNGTILSIAPVTSFDGKNKCSERLSPTPDEKSIINLASTENIYSTTFEVAHASPPPYEENIQSEKQSWTRERVTAELDDSFQSFRLLRQQLDPSLDEELRSISGLLCENEIQLECDIHQSFATTDFEESKICSRANYDIKILSKPFHSESEQKNNSNFGTCNRQSKVECSECDTPDISVDWGNSSKIMESCIKFDFDPTIDEPISNPVSTSLQISSFEQQLNNIFLDDSEFNPQSLVSFDSDYQTRSINNYNDLTDLVKAGYNKGLEDIREAVNLPINTLETVERIDTLTLLNGCFNNVEQPEQDSAVYSASRKHPASKHSDIKILPKSVTNTDIVSSQTEDKPICVGNENENTSTKEYVSENSASNSSTFPEDEPQMNESVSHVLDTENYFDNDNLVMANDIIPYTISNEVISSIVSGSRETSLEYPVQSSRNLSEPHSSMAVLCKSFDRIVTGPMAKVTSSLKGMAKSPPTQNTRDWTNGTSSSLSGTVNLDSEQANKGNLLSLTFPPYHSVGLSKHNYIRCISALDTNDEALMDKEGSVDVANFGRGSLVNVDFNQLNDPPALNRFSANLEIPSADDLLESSFPRDEIPSISITEEKKIEIQYTQINDSGAVVTEVVEMVQPSSPMSDFIASRCVDMSADGKTSSVISKCSNMGCYNQSEAASNSSTVKSSTKNMLNELEDMVKDLDETLNDDVVNAPVDEGIKHETDDHSTLKRDPPLLVISIDNDIGIPKGDIMLSLLSSNENESKDELIQDNVWPSKVKDAIWRCRTMRRNCDTKWLASSTERNSPRHGQKRSIAVDVDDVRIVGGVEAIGETQASVLEYLNCDDFSDALVMYESILDIYNNYALENECTEHSIFQHKIYVATTLHNIGVIHLLNGNFKDAFTFFERATMIRAGCFGVRHADHIASLVKMSLCLFSLGDFPSAHSSLEYAANLGKDNIDNLADLCQFAEILNNIACLAFMCGEIRTAADRFRQCRALLNVLGENSLYMGSKYSCHTIAMNTSICDANLALLAFGDRDIPTCIRGLESAMKEQHLLLRDAHPTLLTTMEHLVAANIAGGNKIKALQLLRRMLHIQIDTFGSDHKSCQETCKKILYLEKQDNPSTDLYSENRAKLYGPSSKNFASFSQC